MDSDSYMIDKKDGVLGFGKSLKAAVYIEANAFCREKGLEVETMSITTTPEWPGHFSTIGLQFRCISPGAKARPLVKEPDTVIEIRNR